MELELGMRVKDLVTGFTGIACARTKVLSGVERISVQAPMTPDGKIENGYDFDINQLEILDPEQVVKPIPSIEIDCTFGDEVTHIASGFTGKVTGISYYLNGCVNICVQRPVDKKEGFLPDGKWLSYAGLLIKKAEKPLAKPSRATGGPVTRTPSFEA